MAKIRLTEGYTVIPEGTHVFKIINVLYKEDFGKLEIVMQTQSGSKHTEYFRLLRPDGSPNEGAYNAFSYFAKTALQNFGLNEIDPNDLVGHFIECDVEHDVQPNKNKPDKTITFIRLTDKRQSDGWEDKANTSMTYDISVTSPVGSQVISKSSPQGEINLTALLG